MEPKEYRTMFDVEDVHWWYVGLRKLIYDVLERLFPDRSNLEVLDAGCGTGALLEMLRACGHATGIDISPEALSFARRRGLKRLGCGSVMDLPFGAEQFDVVTSIDVIYHLQVADDTQALREFRRVLKGEGVLILNLPAYDFLMSRHDRAIHTKRRYTRKDIGRKLAAAGFRLRHITYRNTLLFPPVLFVRTMEKKSKKVESDLKRWSSPVNRILLSIVLLENRMLRAMRLPFGSSVFCIARKESR